VQLALTQGEAKNFSRHVCKNGSSTTKKRRARRGMTRPVRVKVRRDRSGSASDTSSVTSVVSSSSDDVGSVGKPSHDFASSRGGSLAGTVYGHGSTGGSGSPMAPIGEDDVPLSMEQFLDTLPNTLEDDLTALPHDLDMFGDPYGIHTSEGDMAADATIEDVMGAADIDDDMLDMMLRDADFGNTSIDGDLLAAAACEEESCVVTSAGAEGRRVRPRLGQDLPRSGPGTHSSATNAECSTYANNLAAATAATAAAVAVAVHGENALMSCPPSAERKWGMPGTRSTGGTAPAGDIEAPSPTVAAPSVPGTLASNAMGHMGDIKPTTFDWMRGRVSVYMGMFFMFYAVTFILQAGLFGVNTTSGAPSAAPSHPPAPPPSMQTLPRPPNMEAEDTAMPMSMPLPRVEGGDSAGGGLAGTALAGAVTEGAAQQDEAEMAHNNNAVGGAVALPSAAGGDDSGRQKMKRAKSRGAPPPPSRGGGSGGATPAATPSDADAGADGAVFGVVMTGAAPHAPRVADSAGATPQHHVAADGAAGAAGASLGARAPPRGPYAPPTEPNTKATATATTAESHSAMAAPAASGPLVVALLVSAVAALVLSVTTVLAYRHRASLFRRCSSQSQSRFPQPARVPMLQV